MSKTHPTIPEGDLGFDAISYAREIVSTPSHHDADEFSACARETLSAMLAAWDRLSERHNTLFRNHAFLMATKIPPTVISIPAPPADAAREALRYCEEVFQHNEINRVDGEEIADRALVLIRRALSTPAPAPSADPWRACGCADPDNCEHVFRTPASSAPAMRRCEQPEVKK